MRTRMGRGPRQFGPPVVPPTVYSADSMTALARLYGGDRQRALFVGTPVPVSTADVVSGWTDQIGTGANMTLGAAPSAPSLINGGASFNNRNVIAFGGLGQHVDSPASAVSSPTGAIVVSCMFFYLTPQTQDFSMVYAIRADADDQFTTTSAGFGYMMHAPSGSLYLDRTDGAGGDLFFGNYIGTLVRSVLVIKADGTTKHILNGVTVATSTTTAGAAIGPAQILVGASPPRSNTALERFPGKQNILHLSISYDTSDASVNDKIAALAAMP